MHYRVERLGLYARKIETVVDIFVDQPDDSTRKQKGKTILGLVKSGRGLHVVATDNVKAQRNLLDARGARVDSLMRLVQYYVDRLVETLERALKTKPKTSKLTQMDHLQ